MLVTNQDAWGDHQTGGREVPDRLHAGRDQAVHQYLGCIGRRRQNSQPNHVTFNKGFNPLYGLYRAVRDLFANLVLVVVEGRHNIQPVALKARIGPKGGSQMSDTHQHGLILLVESQNDFYETADFTHIKVHSTHFLKPDGGKILSDLRGVDVESFDDPGVGDGRGRVS